MSLKPAAAAAAAAASRFLGGRLASQKVRFTRPLFFGQLQERLLKEVLFATDVLGYGVGAVVATAEARPLFGTQATAAVSTVRICPCQHINIYICMGDPDIPLDIFPPWTFPRTFPLPFYMVQDIFTFHNYHHPPIYNVKRSTMCLKKGCHFYFCNNFGNCRPILIALSLLYYQIHC